MNEKKVTAYSWMVLFTVLVGTFMGVVDSTIVNVGLPKIRGFFGVSLSAVQWVSTAYMLVLAVMLLLSPWMGEKIGYKITFIIGLSFFTLFSFMCGISWSLNSLLFFRAIQGFGGGILGTVGMVLWRREFPPERQALPMGIYMVAVGGAVAFGPPLGGYLIQYFDWPSIFFVNVPVGIIGLVASLIVLKKDQRNKGVPPLDWGGFLSLSTFLTAMLIAVAEGNAPWNTEGWTSNFMKACYAITFVGFVSFLFIELRAKHPLVDLRIFTNFNFAIGGTAFTAYGVVLGGIAMIGPLFCQTALNYSQLESGLVILPLGVVMSAMGIITGLIAGRISMKLMLVVGLLILAYSLHLAAGYGVDTGRNHIVTVGAVMGLGLGTILTPLSTLMLTWMPPHLLGAASGTYQALRNVAGAIGVALFQTLITRRSIFHEAMYGQTAVNYLSNVQIAMIEAQRYLYHQSGQTKEVMKQQASLLIGVYFKLQAFISSVNDDYFLGMVIILSCILPSLLLKERRGVVIHVTE